MIQMLKLPLMHDLTYTQPLFQTARTKGVVAYLTSSSSADDFGFWNSLDGDVTVGGRRLWALVTASTTCPGLIPKLPGSATGRGSPIFELAGGLTIPLLPPPN